MLVAFFDEYPDDIALLQPASIAQVDFAVDFRRVGLGAAGGADVMVMLRMGSVEVPSVRAFLWRSNLIDAVDQHVDGLADLGGELFGARCGR